MSIEWDEERRSERDYESPTNLFPPVIAGIILAIFGFIFLIISVGMNSIPFAVFSIFIILVGLIIIARATAYKVEWEQTTSGFWHVFTTDKFKLLNEEEIQKIPKDAIDLWTQERIWEGIARGERVYKCLGKLANSECGLYYLESSLREFKRCANPYCSNHKIS